MRLAQAQKDALRLLAEDGGEVSLRPYESNIWLGVGYCVAKGWAVYRGDDNYMITPRGLAAHAKPEEAR